MRTLAITALLAVLLAGCSRGSAGELLETARLEEVQRNVPNARKLYTEIVEKYPDSPEATEARARLAALEGAP